MSEEQWANCNNCGHAVSFPRSKEVSEILNTFLTEILGKAKGDLIRLHIEAAKKSESIFTSTKTIQQYYKFMHRIEVITELLEEI